MLRLLGRLRLWHQFFLLGLFAVSIPIYITTSSFWADGRQILTDHEIIDLSDESNLRVNEIREEFDYLARDLQQEARVLSMGKPPGEFRVEGEAALIRFLKQFPANIPAPGERAKTIAQVRRRHFSETLLYGQAVTLTWPVGAPEPGIQTAVSLGPNGTPAKPADPAFDTAVRESILRSSRMAPLTPSSISGLHLTTANGDKPPRCVVALARVARWDSGRPIALLVVVLDFTRYIENRARMSPRHQYLVTNAGGTLLVHPDSTLVARGAKIQDKESAGWEIPGHAWPAGNETTEERELRQARMLRDGGVRLAGVEIANLAAKYRKGHLPDSLQKTLGDNVLPEIAKANKLLADEARQDPKLRYAELSANSAYIEFAHPDKARLAEVAKKLDAWWSGAQNAGSKIDWIDPLECKVFQGQLTHLRLDQNDDDEPARLVVVAALEELREDIDTKFSEIILWPVVPTVAIAAGLTVLVVVVLTNSLRRLARTADVLGDPKAKADTAVPGGGCLEVSMLAKSLRTMSTRLRDDAARFQTILRAAGEGIVVASGDGVIEEANRAAAKMFGFDKPEDLIRRKVSELIADPLPKSGLASVRELQSTAMPSRGSPFFDAVRGKRKDGSYFWLEVTLRPVALRDRQVVTCVFRDVTDRKRAEEQIRQMNEDLEHRVRVRTAELTEATAKIEVALKQAEAAIRAKDTFVANMSHELRQPLHIIIGFTEALREEAVDGGRQELVPDLNKILAAAKHLLDLINDILDLAKISSGRMELSISRFAVSRLVEDVRVLVSPLSEKNSNRFVVDAPGDLGDMVADERRTRQVLINLLSNAFKFTVKGIVTLRVRKIFLEGKNWIEFAVSDTGKGMNTDQVGRLFQRFYQADPSTTREQGGTGLGLAITQSFNDLMGGRPIVVTSAPNMGSEFLVRLPVEVAPEPTGRSSGRLTRPPEFTAPAKTSTESQPTTGAKVLVIDDDPMVLELMTRFLEKEGFRVLTASSAADGLQLARDAKPTVITLDVMMPGTNGWTVLSELKENPATCDIPVVMLTIVDDRGRGFALGAADYLTKPIDWARLGTILRNYLPADRSAPVLVVDDEVENRQVLRRHLEKEGWRVTEAGDGEAGLRSVAADPPALVLLDLMMPGVDGFGFLDEYPKRFPGSRTPVVVLTAKDLNAEDFDRLNGRVARILAKGDLAHLDHLVSMIRRHTD